MVRRPGSGALHASSSLLHPAAGGGDLARRHEISDIFLQKLVVTVKLVVFFLDCLNSVEQDDEGLL